MHIAAQNGSISVVNVLLASPKIDVNLQDCDGQTPLHFVCIHTHQEAFCSLMEMSSISTNLKNKMGNTPLMEAILSNNMFAVRALIANPKVDIRVKNKNQVCFAFTKPLWTLHAKRTILKPSSYSNKGLHLLKNCSDSLSNKQYHIQCVDEYHIKKC